MCVWGATVRGIVTCAERRACVWRVYTAVYCVEPCLGHASRSAQQHVAAWATMLAQRALTRRRGSACPCPCPCWTTRVAVRARLRLYQRSTAERWEPVQAQRGPSRKKERGGGPPSDLHACGAGSVPFLGLCCLPPRCLDCVAYVTVPSRGILLPTARLRAVLRPSFFT